MGKWLAQYGSTLNEPPKSKTLPLPILTVQLFRAIFSCRAANKEVQRVIGTIIGVGAGPAGQVLAGPLFSR